MSLNPLLATSSLRFTDRSNNIIGGVYTIDGDRVDTVLSEIKADIVTPVYGNPYIIIQGKRVSKYTNGSLKFEAPISTMTALDSFLQTRSYPSLILRYGGVDCPEVVLMSGILTSVHYTRDLSYGEDLGIGQISYINN